MKKISTSALSKNLGVDSKELIKLLQDNGYISVKNKSLLSSEKIKVLTQKGNEAGAELKTGTKFGDYIIWPESFNPYEVLNIKHVEYINVSSLAEKFGYSARKMNQIISELGWIEPNIKGWKLTKFGEGIGGKEFQHTSGGTFTKWPNDILNNKSLLDATGKNVPNEGSVHSNKKDNHDELNFRDKFPAKYRTKDGHNVRSRGELVIDNSLYEYGLAHAYERKLPIEEDVYSDFYIPAKNGGKAVYIEYWGIEDQERYENRKQIKKDIYEKYHLNLIELKNRHIDNLDDYLPKMLLEFGIRVD